MSDTNNTLTFTDSDQVVVLRIFFGHTDINQAKISAYGMLKLAEEQISLKFMERTMRDFKTKQALGLAGQNGRPALGAS